MSELSDVVFYFLSTVAQVCAAILGFFIVGQIYFRGVIHKVREKNEVIRMQTGVEGCRNIVVIAQIIEQVKNIYILLLAIILLSILGIFLNIESIFGKGILIIPALVLVLCYWGNNYTL